MANWPKKSAERVAFLDLFRGLAVLFMMDAHVTNALVRAPLDASRLYQYHKLLFNLPGPAFLFASGISFGMSVSGRWEEYRMWSKTLRRRLLRLLEILALAYFLHLPYFSLRRTVFQGTQRQIASLLNMDVLQCIVASAFLLLILVWVLPSRKWFPRACLGLTAAIALAAPVLWNLAPQLPWWLGTIVSRRWGSVFPLLPYAGFAVAGAAWGSLYAMARSTETAENFLRKTRQFGLWLLLGSLVAAWLPLPRPYDDFWNASPVFFLLRAGLLTWAAAALPLAESRCLTSLQFLKDMGKESLVVYIVHLAVVYGSVFNAGVNLRAILGSGNSLWEGLGVLALLTVAMTILAKLWTRLKEESVWKVDRIEWAVAGCLAVVFIVR